MKNGYVYCQNKDTCLHRFGCRRFIGNYEDEAVKEMQESGRDSYIDDKDCLPDYSDINNENGFELLDRFRLSDGSPLR